MTGKVGDKTSFYNLRTKRKEQAKINKITKKGGVRIAHGTSKKGKKLTRILGK